MTLGRRKRFFLVRWWLPGLSLLEHSCPAEYRQRGVEDTVGNVNQLENSVAVFWGCGSGLEVWEEKCGLS